MRTLRFVSPLLALTVAVVACAPPEATDERNFDDPSTIANALDTDDGAMSLENEAPFFADPAVRDLAEFVAAPQELQSAEDPSAPAANLRSYHLAIVWGHLPGANDTTTADPDPVAVDWTGSVSVAKGAVGVARTLAFDARDSLVRDGSKRTVSFVSHTLPRVDGLYLHVVIPADAPQTLRFDTASLKTDIDLASLKDEFVGGERLGDGRNGMVYGGYPDVAGCARGLAFGRWVKARPGLGRFRGRVMDGGGDTIGHVRGVWGHAPKRDVNVFFGKYIGTDGDTRGLLGGTYGGGEAKGRWKAREAGGAVDAGGVQIRYFDGYEKADGRGVWMGRWSEKCER